MNRRDFIKYKISPPKAKQTTNLSEKKLRFAGKSIY